MASSRANKNAGGIRRMDNGGPSRRGTSTTSKYDPKNADTYGKALEGRGDTVAGHHVPAAGTEPGWRPQS